MNCQWNKVVLYGRLKKFLRNNQFDDMTQEQEEPKNSLPMSLM
jgi:hypothetical protein